MDIPPERTYPGAAAHDVNKINLLALFPPLDLIT
jgi:hypothetical protein